MHKNKKLYPCFGYEITIDQAAECACVSVAAVRGQLTKLGGSMETVMQMYEKRYGGVIARMEQMMEYDADKQAAKDIMAALGFADDEETEHQDGQVAEDAIAAPATNVIPLAENTEIMILTEEEKEAENKEPRIMFAPIEKDDSGDRKELKLLNDAIEALEKLEEVETVEESAGAMREDVLLKLKEIRMDGYEHLINWRAIAEGK